MTSLALLLTTPATAGLAASEYTFFVGTDIEFSHDQDTYSLTGVRDRDLEGLSESKIVSIPRKQIDSIRIERTPKISDEYATISDLDFKRAYSSRNDPNLRWQAAMSAMQSHAREHQDHITANALASVRADAIAGANVGESLNRSMGVIEEAIENTNRIDEMASDVPANLEGEHDAIEITFQLAAPAALSNPYIVALVFYVDPEDGVENVRTIFQRLSDMGDQANTVRVNAAGFPYDYTLLDATVLLFDSGREIATNLSEKQASVTRDQAIRYLRFARKNRSPNGTLPAMPISGFAPVGFFEALSTEEATRRVVISVDAEGNVAGIANADDAASEISPDVAATIVEIPFYPALQEGKPVSSSVETTLRQLLL